jgi:hypothetical protein
LSFACHAILAPRQNMRLTHTFFHDFKYCFNICFFDDWILFIRGMIF